MGEGDGCGSSILGAFLVGGGVEASFSPHRFSFSDKMRQDGEVEWVGNARAKLAALKKIIARMDADKRYWKRLFGMDDGDLRKNSSKNIHHLLKVPWRLE